MSSQCLPTKYSMFGLMFAVTTHILHIIILAERFKIFVYLCHLSSSNDSFVLFICTRTLFGELSGSWALRVLSENKLLITVFFFNSATRSGYGWHKSLHYVS